MLNSATGTIVRRARQIAADPVLRRWLVRRALRLTPGAPGYTPHQPPYLTDRLPIRTGPPDPSPPFLELPPDAPTSSLKLSLASRTIEVEPGDETQLFERRFPDLEDHLALHRFSWLPLAKNIDPAWVSAIFGVWREFIRRSSDPWIWHPYTAAERAVNLLEFGRAHGLPAPLADTLDLLADHAARIGNALEYFGRHNTSNHLANNGRGLYLLGLELGLAEAREIGRIILMKEAERVFMPSGVLREGSSHYHLLLARNYFQVANAAAARNRPEAAGLSAIAERSLRAAAALVLPGGLPLIGDISPDCPPSDLMAALPGQPPAPPDILDRMAADGWLRFAGGSWTGLWYVPPDGWPPMPGHGHNDCGSFELHFGDQPIFVDPGRGRYCETAEAAHYRSGAAHNGLGIDGLDAYPANRPYYSEEFRRIVCGGPPDLTHTADSVSLRFEGFKRRRGLGAVERHWRFAGADVVIADTVEGSGRHKITRRIATPLSAELFDNEVKLSSSAENWSVSMPGDVSLQSITRWRAYGRGTPMSQIVIEETAALPWRGEIRVRAI
ncbi:MAG: heparinase II/III family protein [Rhodospirillales bacterium]|nr:heparinase II/III family protein [Rhodospirillales bacterium]